MSEEGVIRFDHTASASMPISSGEVTVVASATITDDTVDVRAEFTDVLNTISSDAEWEVAQVANSVDDSGFPTISMTFKSRIPVEKIQGLGDTLKDLSRPGRKYSLRNVDYALSNEQKSELSRELREKIYNYAVDELRVTNRVLLDEGHWRIGKIDFGTIIVRTEHGNQFAVVGDTVSSSFNVTNQVSLSASISLVK